ncbi:ABC transporter substrate-binding protein [uncultured Sphaerochaeta sp.]|uniref:ABC transporter substrate-binding protein n=1 Tax=uncultured Sphaerochaeta sp. TaxID=886478 RepID=UPI002A0A6213|nr:ABC transporter substrate-binding protein [uncultured Sphaerochaeta sp.]
MKKLHQGFVVLAVLLFCSTMLFANGTKEAATDDQGPDEITVHMKWLPQAQFMGYYVAAAKGYYADENLKVNIVPCDGTITPEQAVSTGTAQVGVTWVSTLLTYIAQGYDFEEVSQIYQKSGLLLVSKKATGIKSSADITASTKVGNWGLGNEYEVKALLQKLGLPTEYVNQDFTMNGFDKGTIDLASAMTYNEYGLVINSYEGALGYGADNVNVIDMNDEGVAMMEDCLFVSKEWVSDAKNADILVRFLRASIKGWKTACDDPNAAAKIVHDSGSSVSLEHQIFMAEQVKKLVEPESAPLGSFDATKMQQTLDLTKKYAELGDSSAMASLQKLTLSDLYTDQYYKLATK